MGPHMAPGCVLIANGAMQLIGAALPNKQSTNLLKAVTEKKRPEVQNPVNRPKIRILTSFAVTISLDTVCLTVFAADTYIAMYL